MEIAGPIPSGFLVRPLLEIQVKQIRQCEINETDGDLTKTKQNQRTTKKRQVTHKNK